MIDPHQLRAARIPEVAQRYDWRDSAGQFAYRTAVPKCAAVVVNNGVFEAKT